jgi:hypothetical protein
MQNYCCPLKPTSAFSGNTTGICNIYQDDGGDSNSISFINNKEYKCTDINTSTNLPYSTQISKRTYNEALGDPASLTPGADIAPKFNMMSSPVTVPSVFIVKTANSFTPNIEADTRDTSNTGTYKNTISIDTSNPTSLFFLTYKNIYVSVASLTNSTNSYGAQIESYSNGTLNLKNISANSVSINGTITPDATSFSLPADYYTVSYTDNTAFSQETTNSTTLTPLIIAPTNGGEVELTIQLLNTLSTIFPTGTQVLVTNVSRPTSNFTGKVLSIDTTSSELYAKMRIKEISDINGTFTEPAIYAIIVTSTNPTSRFWLTTQEKRIILNMIAQSYYDLSGGRQKMQTIFDVYQVGDTIFDVRFLQYRRNTTETTKIQDKMTELTNNYQLYRTYNLSEDQLVELDNSYTSDMIELNRKLDSAVSGRGNNCGISAQYIVIQRIDPNSSNTKALYTDLSGIQLSQIIVVDNTGNNAALNCLVTPTSTYTYNFEETDSFLYVSPPGCKIESDGSIRDSNNNIIAPSGTCKPVNTSVTPKTALNCDIASDNTISVKRPTSSNGDTAQIKSVKLTRNQSLVDGGVTLIDESTNKYNTRVMPYYFRTATCSNRESVTIDLGSTTDIVKVRLVFPKGYTDRPKYNITFLDSMKNQINAPNISAPIPLIVSGQKPTGSDTLDINCSKTPQVDGCPTDLLTPYTVARFYATIDTTTPGKKYIPGNPTASLNAISFTGYSLGVNAALTFNPMYNAGFTLNTTNGSGNTNYNPIILYTKNTPIVNPASISGNLCTYNNGKFLINIMRDYMKSISQYAFKSRADVIPLNYDPSTYSYNVTNIIKAGQIEAGKYAIHWQEIRTNLSTNVKDPVVDRRGTFVYIVNQSNWAANDIYYDIKSSSIYANDLSTVTYTTCNITVPDLLPTEADSLDNAGGVCPSAKCSDTNVINDLVQQFNDISGSQYNTQILRVTKAVTVSQTQCDYEVYMQNKNNRTTTEKKNISMNLSVINNSTGCHYVWDRSDILDETSGKYIQSNTPFLLHVFNYATEIMQPYVTSLANVQTSLTNLITTNTINNDYAKYIGDTYGAYGQIKDLSGCNATDNNSGRAKCYSQPVMNEFMKAYNSNISNRGINIIKEITHAGTASDTECDYVISVGAITNINGSSATIGAQGITKVVRAKMKKSTNCYFSVDTTYVNGGLQNNTLPMTTAQIKAMKPVALDQTPWTTPTTLGTQTNAQQLNLTTSLTSIQLTVPRSDSYKIGTAVQVIDMKNSNNNFNATIGNYQASSVNPSAQAILTLNNITTQTGTFNTLTKYTIRAIPQNGATTQGISAVETIDYVDCTSPYVNKLLPNIGQNSSSQMTNVSATVCQINGQQYRFEKGPGTINSLTVATSVSGLTGSISNVRSTLDTTNVDTSVVSSMTSATAQALYSSIDTSVNPIYVSANKWDFRVNISDTLPFGDTYKRITFYKDTSNRNRIRLIEDAPASSGFAFFQLNPITVSNTQTLVANAARDWWNKQYAIATTLQNKSIIGVINGCYYDSTNDLVILVANACDYGIYGATDVRSNPSIRYFSTQIRKIRNSTSLIYNRVDTTNANTIFVYSMTEVVLPTTLSLISFTNPYSALPQDTTDGYDPTKSLAAVLTDSKSFRYLRFSVQKTPVSDTNTNKIAYDINGSGGGGGAEILQMNFYTEKNGTLDSTRPLIFNYATYSVDGVKPLNYNVYSTVNSVTNQITISPVVNQSITLNVSYTTGFLQTNSVIVYDTATAKNYFLGTISSIIVNNSITIACNFIGSGSSFVNNVKYTIAVNGCSTGYSVSSDPYLLSYMKCTLTNPVTYTMRATTYSDFVANYELPCGIGFTKSGTICTSTGIYSNVITQNLNMNLAVRRLRLNINQYFNISLNETVKINYFNFTTGVANTRPQKWILEGSICGLDDAKYWVPLHSTEGNYEYDYATEVTSTTSVKTQSGLNIYSFVTTNYFPIFSSVSAVASTKGISNIHNSGTNVNYIFDPSITATTPIAVNSITAGSSTYKENFQNPSVLHKTSNPKFRQQVPNLENSYKIPLEQPISRAPTQMQIQGERRIQFLRIKILSTRKNTGSIHMSNLEFVTPLGVLPVSHYKISNPMGIHPSRKNGPDALSNGGVWIISNNEPLLVKFTSLPQVVIEGFQFVAPNIKNPFDSLPATWVVEGSYDGRVWSTYNETLVPQNFSSYNSPVYKFLKDI